jgi:[ribosomal protein S5]-alanine N-acetyltransferase
LDANRIFITFSQMICHYYLKIVVISSEPHDKTSENLSTKMARRYATKSILVTNRLYLRELETDDLDFLTALHQDKAVMQYIGPLRSRDQVADRIGKIIHGYSERPGLGIWMCCLRNSHTPIGWACLKDLDGTAQIEVGYRFARSYWGNGYATEITRSLLTYGFQDRQIPEIAAVTRPDNLASRRVLEKAGLTFQGQACFYQSEVLYFKIRREEWLKTQG